MKITSLIREYRQSHPGAGAADIRQALRIAESSSGTGLDQKALRALLVGLVAAGLMVALLLSKARPGPGQFGAAIWPLVVVLVLVGLLIVAVAARR